MFSARGCRVKTWPKNQNWVQVFFKNLLLSAGRMSFSKANRKKKTKITIFKIWSNYVMQHIWTKFWLNLGPSLDSTFLTFLAFFQNMPKALFYGVSRKDLAHLPKIGTLFVNTAALTEKKLSLFPAFLFFVFVVFGFGFFWEQWKKQTFKQNNEKEIILVTKMTTQTKNTTISLFRLQKHKQINHNSKTLELQRKHCFFHSLKAKQET